MEDADQLAEAFERADRYHAENDELFKRAVKAETELAAALRERDALALAVLTLTNERDDARASAAT